MSKRRRPRDPGQQFAAAYRRAIRRALTATPKTPRPRRKHPIKPQRARVEAERCVQRFTKRLKIRSATPGSSSWTTAVDAVEAAILEDPHLLQADADSVIRGVWMKRRPPETAPD